MCCCAGSPLQRYHVSSLLKDAVVRDVVWERKGGRLFFGDDQGRVAVANLPKVSSLTMQPTSGTVSVCVTPHSQSTKLCTACSVYMYMYMYMHMYMYMSTQY